jgi:AbrB family looped-hinge helix DNA binding protein
MNITKVGHQGQIAIPQEIQQQLQLEEGDRLAFICRDDEVLIQPLKATLLDFRGSVPVPEAQDFGAVRQEVLERGAYRNTVHED